MISAPSLPREDARDRFLKESSASQTDAELLARWRRGCAQSGRELLSRYHLALLRFFRAKVGDDAQDLLQRSVLACLEKRDSLRDTAKFRAFLFGVARLELLRSINERRRWPDAIDPTRITLPDPQENPSSVVAQRQDRQRLARALPQLPRPLQIVVALHYWEHLSATEIGDVIGVPTGTVKSRLRRAKALLFEELGSMRAPSDPDEPTGLDAWANALRSRPSAT